MTAIGCSTEAQNSPGIPASPDFTSPRGKAAVSKRTEQPTPNTSPAPGRWLGKHRGGAQRDASGSTGQNNFVRLSLCFGLHLAVGLRGEEQVVGRGILGVQSAGSPAGSQPQPPTAAGPRVVLTHRVPTVLGKYNKAGGCACMQGLFGFVHRVTALSKKLMHFTGYHRKIPKAELLVWNPQQPKEMGCSSLLQQWHQTTFYTAGWSFM